MLEHYVFRQAAADKIVHQFCVSLPVHPPLEVLYLYIHARQISFPGKDMQRHRVYENAVQVKDEGHLPSAMIHAERITRLSTMSGFSGLRRKYQLAFFPRKS
jgi:hypothetical protein